MHEVYDNGAAAKDGRLLPGDQILEVCNHLSMVSCEFFVFDSTFHCDFHSKYTTQSPLNKRNCTVIRPTGNPK